DRLGPTHQRLYRVRGQMCTQRRTFGRTDDIILEYIEIFVSLLEMRQPQISDALEPFSINRGDPSAMLDPPRQNLELHVEHGGLYVVQKSRVPVKVVLASLTVLAVETQQRRRPSEVDIVRRDGAAVTE